MNKINFKFLLKNYVFIYSLLTSFLCYLPLFFSLDLSSSSSSSLSNITIISKTYFQIIISSLSITLPLILDGIINIDLPLEIILSRFLLFLSILIPNLFILIINYNNNNIINIKITLCCLFSRQILSIGGMIIVFNNKMNYFKQIKFISVIIGGICYTMAPLYYFLPQYQNIIMLIYIIGGSISLIGLIFMCSYYIWKVINLPVISSLEKYCAIIAATVIVGMIVRGIITFTFNIAGPRISLSVLISKTLIDTISSIFAFILPSRIAIEDAAMAKLELSTKKNFVRYVSHEVRTPLNTVFMGLQLLSSSSLLKIENEETKEFSETLSCMSLSCEIAINTLNDLLLYDKIEDGKIVLEKRPTSVESFIHNCLKPFELQAKFSNINLKYLDADCISTALNSCYIDIDVNKMSQVLRNLVSNALKFTPKNGDVSIKAYRILKVDEQRRPERILSSPLKKNVIHCAKEVITQSDVGPILRIEVHDTGPGISLDDQNSLFAQFTQFNAANLQAGQGTGLGLWISRSIVERHNGRIGFVEKEGGGAIFYFELDLLQLPYPPHVTSSELPRPDESTRESNPNLACQSPVIVIDEGINLPPLKHSRALVVDDSSMNRKLLGKLLAPYFDNIEEAEDGAAAVESVQNSITCQQPYNIIFIDNIMPKLTGPEAALILRNKIGYHQPIIGVTGNTLSEDVNLFISSGATQVLSKPVNKKDIQNVLKLLIEQPL